MVPHTENSTPQVLAAPHSAMKAGELRTAPPGLHRCLLVSFSDQRGELFRLAAENQSWQPIVCSSVDQFLRSLFRLRVSLTVVDLPKFTEAHYAELREATGRVGDLNDSLIVVCGYGNPADEELWARQLGAWAYLPVVGDPEKLELVFGDARQAVENLQKSSDAERQIKKVQAYSN